MRDEYVRDKYAEGEPPRISEESARVVAARDEDSHEDKEYEVALADAARRVHDAELAALANLALIRSTLDKQGMSLSGGGEKGMEERLRDLVSDLDDMGR